MKTFIVDETRFLNLYTEHVSVFDKKYIEWYVDETTLHCYIVTELACYYYYVNKNIVSEVLKNYLKKEGEILGVLEDKQFKESLSKQEQLILNAKVISFDN
jgi:hypothetical protein